MMKFSLSYIVVFVVTVCSLIAQEDQDYKIRMRKAVDNSNFNLALQIYAGAEQDDYYDMESLQRMSCECYYSLNELSKAETICKKLYDEEENSNLTDLIYMCILASKGNSNDDKIAEIANKMGEYPLEKTILRQMSLISNKDINRVISAINRYTVSKNIVDKEELKNYKTILTVMYFFNNCYTDAYNSSIDYLTMDNQPVIYYILGILRERRQEYASAISFLSFAIKNGYNHYDAYLQRAICKGYEGEYVSSNKDLDTCIMIDSNYYAFYVKGVNYCHLHLYQDALTNFDYSITLNDSFSESYNYRGIAYTNLKEYEFALRDFKQALYLDKKTEYAHNNLGIAYEQIGRLADAIEEYKLSIKYEPDFEGGYYNLGRIYTDLHLTSKAIKYLTKAAEIDSEISDVYYLLGVNYQEKDEKETACKYFSLALELDHTKAQEKIDNYCN
ncbi:MAG: tetratricopeptide repeat protein, partial [Bacteroidales bacterium]|nr:tetratricopeptide repeat protein [Bacteroidales bacterium]